jgi:hypothetical protein
MLRLVDAVVMEPFSAKPLRLSLGEFIRIAEGN